MYQKILYIHDFHMPAVGSDLIKPISGWESILIGQTPSIKYPEWMNKLFRTAMNEDCNYIIFASDADQDADREDIPSYAFYWHFDGNDFVMGDPVSGTQIRLSYAQEEWAIEEIAKILKGEQTYFRMVYEYKWDTEPLQAQNIINTHDDLHSIIVRESLLRHVDTDKITADNLGFIRMIASAYKGGE